MSGSLLPNITYAAQGIPLYAASSGGGGGGGGISSFQTLTASTINVGTVLNAPKVVAGTVLTSTLSGFTTLAGQSTLIGTLPGTGMWSVNCDVDTTGGGGGSGAVAAVGGIFSVSSNAGGFTRAAAIANNPGTLYGVSVVSFATTPNTFPDLYFTNGSGSVTTSERPTITRLGL